jgi:xyloglucan-specific endo-beta-1,4-glucanase
LAWQLQCRTYRKVSWSFYLHGAAILKLTLLSSQYGADGKPIPFATGIQLAGTTWDLYKGPNGQMTVFSFLPSNGKNIVSFKGDINVFLKYLTQNQGVSASQYLKSLGAGTEPTLGQNAVFTTSKYTVDVQYL